MVRAVGVAQLVSQDEAGALQATLLPIVWDGAGRVIAHASRGNAQFRGLPARTPALAIVTGPDAYIDPSWYPSTKESGLAVPTWDYLVVQLRGSMIVHEETDWLRAAVGDLVAEQPGRSGWSLDAAPDRYLDGMLKGIVGIELLVDDVDAKAKLSSNRVRADRERIVAELRQQGGPGDLGVAGEIEERLRRQAGPVSRPEVGDPA